MQTKFYLTVIHRTLSCESTAILYWFIRLFSAKEDMNKEEPLLLAYEIICFILILFGELVYCEVIVCNFFDLRENTKKEIEKRNNEDFTNARESFNNKNNLKDMKQNNVE